MTKSQITATVTAAITFVAALDTKVDLLTALLPPKPAGYLRLAVICAGILVTAYQQSLNTNHVSIPVKEAKALGVKSEQLKGK